MLSADNLSKQFGPRSGLTKVKPDLGPTCLTLRWYSYKEFFENVKFENNGRQITKTPAKLPSMQRVNIHLSAVEMFYICKLAVKDKPISIGIKEHLNDSVLY